MRPKKEPGRIADEPSRRSFLSSGVKIGAASLALPAFAHSTHANAGHSASDVTPFELDEITLAELQEGMRSGKFTSRGLANRYLARIAEIDKAGPSLNSVIELNPARAPPRRPDPHQGQYRHRRSHED
jgi:amidase